MRIGRMVVMVLVASACGLEDAETGGALLVDESQRAGSATSMAGGNKVTGVASRNLYLGAELGDAIAASTLEEFLAAVTRIWLQVVENDYHTRVEAVADEIAARRPALVGLQEAYTWYTQEPADWNASPATDVAYDYVGELLAALAARDRVYRVAASTPQIDFEAPTLLGFDVRMVDHDVILAREDVTTAGGFGATFDVLLPVSVLGSPFSILRGYASVDVKYRGEWLTFISAHLEAYGPGYFRIAQAGEVVAFAAESDFPVILVGDINSPPGTLAHTVITDAGFDDVWAELHPEEAGFTCCWAEDLTQTGSALYERDDYVFTRGLFDPISIEMTGEALDDRLGGLWPSDHAGLFATLRIEDERFSD
ncbi:MAG TPA: endonuclease/exonuclease/phosphatase family protein [Kofleriaceae bacterium]|nr:endonuclease/exonuclease/phosphatase family protein [Kofleriaceae bacterium]